MKFFFLSILPVLGLISGIGFGFVTFLAVYGKPYTLGIILEIPWYGWLLGAFSFISIFVAEKLEGD